MKLIVACDPDGGIGYQNKLPWDRLDGDLANFKKLTTNQVVVMGRNTWESLPKKPLPNRLNFVVSSQKLELPDGSFCIPNLNCFKNYRNAWLIGGSDLINSSWDMITEVYLSRTYTKYTCDKFISLLYLSDNFTCVSVTGTKDYSYEIWYRNETISRTA
jgi:dihydrofolate reductase